MHEFLSQASNVKLKIRVNGSYCKFNNGLHFQSEISNVTCDDGARIAMHKCNTCNASMWKCPICGTIKNTHKDRKAASRHKRSHDDVKLSPRLMTMQLTETLWMNVKKKILH